MDLAFRKDDLIGFTDTFWQSDYLAPFDISEVKTLVDLGANKGRTALFFFLNAKIERALLVEANSNLNEYIQRTLVSVLDKVEIIIDNSCVLGKSNQTVNFVIVESSRNSHIKRHDESVWDSAVKTIDVQSVSLHELLDKYNFNGSIDLLKMDIEGAEFDILEHDLEVFKRFKYLCFEVHGETEKRKHFFNKIQSIGFDIFKHPHRNEHPLVEILFAAQKNG